MNISSLTSLFLLSVFCGGPALASGVSGGGGNVMFPVDPKEPASINEAHSVVSHARPVLLNYLKDKREELAAGKMEPSEASIFEPLFNTGKGILHVARNTGIDVENRRSCLDSSSAPVDGSIFSGHRGVVCLSSFSISKKVERSDVGAQSVALLAHEFTEVLGFEEDAAVTIQAQVLSDLRGQAGN